MIAESLNEGLKLGLDVSPRLFRADVARGIAEPASSVDREQGIIRNYSVITKGPALGHGIDVDEITLDQVVERGNKSRVGIKSRFDHPNASNTSMGTYIGRSLNFRKVGDRVLADLHLSDAAKVSPNGNLHEYVLTLAEQDPSAFGASIVFTGKPEQMLDAKGKPLTGDDGKDLPARARVDALLASDVVDDPAANPNGLFSAETEQSLATKLTGFLNRWMQHDLLPAIAHLKEGGMSDPKATAEIEQIKAEARKEGEQRERERVAGIYKAFSSVWGEQASDQERKVRDGLVELGTSVDDATIAFKTRKLTQLTTEAPKSAGGAADASPQVELSGLPLEDRCKAEWEKSPALREEFGELQFYIAYERASKEGRVRMFDKTDAASK